MRWEEAATDGTPWQANFLPMTNSSRACPSASPAITLVQHAYDLRAALVRRPQKHAAGGGANLLPGPEVQIPAGGLIDLANQLGC